MIHLCGEQVQVTDQGVDHTTPHHTMVDNGLFQLCMMCVM